MSEHCLGIIGLGEVGLSFGQAMAQAGAEVLAYDVRFIDQNGVVNRAPALDAGITAVRHADLFSRVDIVLSTVTTDVAVDVALAAVPHLSPSHLYVDLNSTSPAVKIRLREIIADSGAEFVEGAILGAVGASGAATRVILTGPAAKRVAHILNTFGLNCEEFGQQIGEAASFKMLRSIFSKGLEALLLEMLVGARRAGIEGALWQEITDFMATHSFEKVASNWIESHAVAYERRYHEMGQVVETLRELDVEPLMAQATLAFFERSLALGLGEVFDEKPDSPGVVIAHFADHLQPVKDAYAP